MRFTFAFAIIFAVANVNNGVDLPFHSKPWICTYTVKKVYENAIGNGVLTHGVACFDDLLLLPDKIKDMCPIKTYTTYMVIGPYIGKSKTFRVVAVMEDELENIDLGKKLEDQFPVECFKCNGKYFSNDIVFISCKELTMEECPERLSGEMYWNPPGNITSTSDAEFCIYRKENGKHEYICTIYDADLEVVS